LRALSLFPLAVALAACAGGDETDTVDETDVVDTDIVDPGPEPVCTEAVEPSCIDDMILDLSLHDDKTSRGEVTTTVDGADFVTVIDATAGGSSQATRNPWVYVQFTAEGAERVDLDDEAALEDMSWDLALRRFMIRLNSGDGGPSCVGAAEYDGAYADIVSVPSDVTFGIEDFYDDTCALQEDASGLPGSPALQLGSWWAYTAGCVETTYQPFLVQQVNGHVLAMVVESYYASGQETCNASGTPGENSGMIQIRWRYVD
jgi:hypothetical protein